MPEDNNKGLIEAALFISARELGIDELKKITGLKNSQKISELVNELISDYEKNNSAIEILKNEEKYLMKIKNIYADRVKELAQDVELSRGAVKILSFVYSNSGDMLKSDIAKKLGPSIYPYVQELVDKKFLDEKKAGRTKRLVITDKFRKYFATGNKTD